MPEVIIIHQKKKRKKHPKGGRKKVVRRPQQGGAFGDFFRGIRAGVKAVSKAGEVSRQFEEKKKKIPPPLPPKRADQKANPLLHAPSPLTLHETLKKYKPITFIDNALKDLDVRDYVRNKLSGHTIGKHLVAAADMAIQQEYGRKRRKHHEGMGLIAT